ncbi:PEGA domain-containing protein [Sphingobacterium wenxiniae]|uniref:PEGA domain-containing protein n=1 Tax=Sphingobacterium wenxiniae TaxID=683125 RepID=A0A1I6P9X0_9SPHI|nr:PEGA domain-containing protein [Sphingobacterium wenxiniae]SFS36930.1 PEGA domain-containing protein [Sphingobacterium wenxiniae]
MKNTCILFILLLLSSFAIAKEVKIVAVPSTAKIYVDGSYVGDGIVTTTLRKKEDFLAVKIEHAGYVTLQTKIYFKDKRNAYEFILKRDDFFDSSTESSNANKFFNVTVSEKYIEAAGNEKEASLLVWKMIHQILLNYYSEIATSDMLSGFVQTPWSKTSFGEANTQVRTRVTVKEANLGGKLTYSIKIESQQAPLSSNREESYVNTDRVLKQYEQLIPEFQSRIGSL